MRTALCLAALLIALPLSVALTFADQQEAAAPAGDAAQTNNTAQTDNAAQAAAADAAPAAGEVAHAAADAAIPAPAGKKISLATLTLSGDPPETSGGGGLFGEVNSDLQNVLDRLRKAAGDDQLSGIVLEIREAELGLGKLNELRTAIAAARAAGKKVYADVDFITGGSYLVASACDEIIMPPGGALVVTGVRAEITFYKRLLENVGVEADFVQIGKYKGAAEPFTRDKMSEEFRQQYESVLDDYYNLIVETIAADRKLPPERVRELIDVGMFSPEEAKAAGLIDRVVYEDQFRAALREELKAEQVSLVRDYGKQQIDTDFSGLAGMMKFFELLTGNEPKPAASRKSKIAVVYAVGAIMTGESTTSLLGGETVGSDTIVKALREAEEDKNVKAIVLRVDSPGGSALASDLIWREITRIEKPIVASMGDVAASGGYYISMGADRIIAEPGTLTGSIGVVGGKIALGGLYDKVGLSTDTISRGRNSGLFSSAGKFSDSEREVWLRNMQTIYDQFTEKAAQGRKMERDRLEQLAQGRVWTGRQALQNGLVDALGSKQDAIDEAKKLAGLEADADVELLILPKPKSFLELLLGDPSLQTRTTVRRQLDTVAPDLAAGLADLERFRKLFAQPAVTILPYRVKVK